jgi:uncharacterized protein YbjQ (UPF0145 family)
MRAGDKVRATTTPGIEGFEIVHHLGPVIAHSVSGAGLYTEFFSSFTDVLGGKSKVTKDRLTEIHEDALFQAKAMAEAKNANWIVGLRVDSGEISGKGKSMLMVTVSGTAVFAEPFAAVDDSKAPQMGGTLLRISDQMLQADEKRLGLSLMSDYKQLNQADVLDEVIDMRVASLAPMVLMWLRKETRDDEFNLQLKADRLMGALRYFDALDTGDATELLYENAEVPSPALDMPERDILVELRLLDLARTAELLECESFSQFWWGVQTLSARKRYYEESDVALMDRCMAAIDARPSCRAELYVEKKFVGSKKVWACLLGHENPHSKEQCACGLDRSGFKEGQMHPVGAREALETARNALASRFAETIN